LTDLLAISIGNMIGAAIFLTPSIVAKSLPSPWLMLAAWAFAGLLSLAGALTLAELGAMLPNSGGQYVYLRESLGRFPAFLFGWTTFIAIRSGGLASLAVAFSVYFGHFIPLSPIASKVLSVSLLLGLGYVNYIGVRSGAAVQNLFTVLKLTGLAAILLAAVVFSGGSPTNWTAPIPAINFSAFGAALIPCLWAYQGWFSVPMVGGEAKNPGRNIPLSLGLSVPIVIAVYLMANVAYLHVFSPIEMQSIPRVGSEAMQRLMGQAGAAFVSACILVSIVGAMNAGVLAGPRVYFAQARDGLFFRRFAEVHPQHATPGFSIWGQAIWSSILAATGSYEALITYAGFTSWLFYALTAAGLFLLRRRQPDAPRPYRVWGYPWTPLVFILVSSAFVLNTIVASPGPAFSGLGLIALGIPYFLWLDRRKPLISEVASQVR
jgi:basic amino acid/polyamine antiporter, APA family